ncbi:MAG: DUF2231 domain-containing protein [Sporichthyaceae bacterium]
MFDTVLGLPVHALVMHVVVVLVPLAAAGVVAIAVVPRWRSRFGVLVLAIATAGLAAVPVATRSGGKLEDRLGASGVVARQINHHQEWGQRVIWPTLAMWLLALLLVFLDRQGRPGRQGRQGRQGTAVKVAAALAVLAAIAAATAVTITGHLGSTAVWSCTIGSAACK